MQNTGTAKYFKLTKEAHYTTCTHAEFTESLVIAKEFEIPNQKGVAMARKSCKTWLPVRLVFIMNLATLPDCR